MTFIGPAVKNNTVVIQYLKCISSLAIKHQWSEIHVTIHLHFIWNGCTNDVIHCALVARKFLIV
jgi:hypothetical protein